MTKNGIIIAHFGSNKRRTRLMREVIERMLAQRGDKVIYVVENLPSGEETRIQKSTLHKVTHIKVKGNPSIWQKEGSYNAGAKRALSDGCGNLIFIDSDIIPETPEWLKEIEEKLKTFDWVHCGRKVFYMSKSATTRIVNDENKEFLGDVFKQKESIEYTHDSLVYSKFNGTNSGFPGGAWAVNKSAWEIYRELDVHGVVGGGDRFHFLRLFKMHAGQTKGYGNIRETLFDPILDKYFSREPTWKVTYINSPIFHLWHGSPSKRSYSKRFKCLVKPGNEELLNSKSPQFRKDKLIDFDHDIKINSDGLVELNEKSEFYEWFLTKFTEYFVSRGDVDTAEVNIYLDYVSADFRLVKSEDGSWKAVSLETYKKITGAVEEVKDEEEKEKGKLGLMTEKEYEKLGEEDPYYKRSRWEYLSEVVNILIEEAPFGRILELGAYKRPVIKGSDTMDIFRTPNLTYYHDAKKIPWPIEDSAYDIFIALQVWEHLGNKQKEAFGEVIRISNRAVLSFPLNWNCPGNCHHGITEEKIAEWTHNLKPVKKIKVGKKNTRIIYIFEFNKEIKSPIKPAIAEKGHKQDEANAYKSQQLKKIILKSVRSVRESEKKSLEEKEKRDDAAMEHKAKERKEESKDLAKKMKKIIRSSTERAN